LQTFLVFYGRKTCLTKWKFFPNFLQIILWKVKIFCVLYCRKFQLPRREKILCKDLSPLPKLISGKKSTMLFHMHEKSLKTGVHKSYFDGLFTV
jgi:hypothetical protein